MTRLWLLLFALVFCAGCESSHPVSAPAQEVLDAVRFADKDGLFRRTLDSVENPYCTSEEFERILKRARAAGEQGICPRLDALEADQVDSVAEEFQLYLQIQRLICDNPQLDCGGYAHAVFEEFWARLPQTTSTHLVKVMGESDRAVAYVELERKGVKHARTLAFELRNGSWFLVSLEALL